MNRHPLFRLALLLVSTVMAVPAVAQEVRPVPVYGSGAPPADLVPLDIQLVVTRYQNEKKVGSVPYSLAVTANDPELSRLRMGASVPVPMRAVSEGKEGVAITPVTSITYRDIGTNIDCRAKTLGSADRFQVMISLEDTSVYTDVKDGTTPAVGPTMPIFRTFRSTNTLVLRDGQTRQFTAATDRVNGEVVRVEVTLRVVK